ncbi:MAG: hypothetical protein AAFV07_02045 [Bacteroidota bacterium]
MKHVSPRSFWFGLLLGLLLAGVPVHAHASVLTPSLTEHFQQKPPQKPAAPKNQEQKELTPEQTPLKAIFQNMLDWLYAPDEKEEEENSTPPKAKKPSKS